MSSPRTSDSSEVSVLISGFVLRSSLSTSERVAHRPAFTSALQDCGGQQSYMDNYLNSQRSNIFKNVALLIYVFDTKSTEWDADVEYFNSVLEGLKEYSVDEDSSAGGNSDAGGGSKKPAVYVLIHKMDLEEKEDRARIEEEKSVSLLAMVRKWIPGGKCKAFGTSIWDESLYKVS
jgi:Ras-related GTP-binding protein A/B